MSYAVGKPQASSPTSNDGPPSTATVYDFICLFTHDLRRKQKRWQDGKLKYHSFNKKVMVYDDRGHFVGDSHWDQEGDLAPGDELSLDRGMALVQVEDCTGEKQQDLTELLDKRAREVEKRRQIAAAKTRPAQRGSLAGGAQPPPQHRPHLSLNSLVQSPGPVGRAAIPAHSPFEARQQRLHQNQPPNADAQPTVSAPPAKKRRTSTSPPSKAGFARNLFGTTLNLSSCPGPELLAARARALRQRMLSQAEATSTPQEDEGVEEHIPMQSSPLFVQDDADATPSRPAKEQRSTLQPVTRHPIASARSVMREAEEVGNRNTEATSDKEDNLGQENAPKKHTKETGKQAHRTAAVDLTTQDAHPEAEPVIPEEPPKRKRKDKEPSQSLKQQQTEDRPDESRKQKPTVTRRSPSPNLMGIDEPDDVEAAPRHRKAPNESQRKKKEREKVAQESPAPVRREPKAKEPRTTLRMRSRQKRGLLMMREPSPPLPELSTSIQEEIDDRVAKTPSPEPSVPPPRQVRSASPEEVTILSSAPPVEGVPEPPPVDRIPSPALPDSSSEDDLPQPSKRRTRKRRTYSPPPEPDVSEEEPKKKTCRKTTKRTACEDENPDAEQDPQPRKRRTAKRTAYDEERGLEPDLVKEESNRKTRRRTTKRTDSEDEDSQAEEDPQPRKRRAAKRSAYNEEVGSELEEGEGEEVEVSAKQGPRIAKLPRKGIRSREILGYIAQGIETMIPVAPSPTVASPIEEKPAFSSHPVPEVAAAAPLEEVVTTTISPLEPLRPQAVAVVSKAAEATTSIQEVSTEPGSRRNATTEAPPPAVRSNSSSNAIAPTTAEANETKLEALSAPEISLARVPRGTTAQASENAAPSEIEKKPDIVLQAPVPVPIEVLPTSESMSSGSETNQAGRPRIANPASRGKKAARREDAAGLAPQVMVPLEPVQPVVARMISTRPGGGAGCEYAWVYVGERWDVESTCA
ncbi:hypothetical protein LMH87_001741 [Akanthomyces muscarius]|uniref:5'-3' DNA helicase ZGRF1-like N-terminal domain-containing protein n=1 Tax=Akanthomyces muscarius TaxID=2231603 RepID=A0A9W8UGF4_AKAMU|nr:hypothetical protein LMH87_001741 [Akanthomyces muscarius]KAJ4147201.1 hypothetical protein LMH87_001741 [Akanthomyces muscarius]